MLEVHLFNAHSGLRYLVFVAALTAIIYYGFGLYSKTPWSKAARIIGIVFVSLLDLQVLLGLALVLMGRWFPALAGHLACMVLAVGVLHATTAINRKRPEPGHKLPLMGSVATLVLIVLGIVAIGRPVL